MAKSPQLLPCSNAGTSGPVQDKVTRVNLRHSLASCPNPASRLFLPSSTGGTERKEASRNVLSALPIITEIHVYSQRVEDLDLGKDRLAPRPPLSPDHTLGKLYVVVCGRITSVGGATGGSGGLAPAIVFSPGINCLDADAIHVHVVFARLREQMKAQLLFRGNSWNTWHQILHRRISAIC